MFCGRRKFLLWQEWACYCVKEEIILHCSDFTGCYGSRVMVVGVRIDQSLCTESHDFRYRVVA